MFFRMGSSQRDRSLGEGTFLPSWMKGRVDSRFDFTDSTFSPPSADDSFFYIPYPKTNKNVSASGTENPTTETGFKTLNEVFGNKHDSVSVVKESDSLDFANKHPLSCQSIQSGEKTHEPKVIMANRTKPNAGGIASDFSVTGTDNQAECGTSIVDKIMATKLGVKSISADAAQTQGSIAQSKMVSKSLPATPMASPTITPDTSPKSRRRVYGNRFFTGAFITDQARQQSSWLLGGILGQPREVVNTKIEEEEDEHSLEPVTPRALSRKKSISSQNLTYISQEQEVQEQQKSTDNTKTSTLKSTIAAQFTALQAKPSELREMNFWSPTSM